MLNQMMHNVDKLSPAMQNENENKKYIVQILLSAHQRIQDMRP